jgi:hypothetical protein
VTLRVTGVAPTVVTVTAKVALPLTPPEQVFWMFKAPAGAAALWIVMVWALAVRVRVWTPATSPPVGAAVSVIIAGEPTTSAPARGPVVAGTVTVAPQATVKSVRVTVPVPDGDGALTEKVALPVTEGAQVLWMLNAPAACRLLTVTVWAIAVRLVTRGRAATPPVGAPVSVIVTGAPTTSVPASGPVAGTATVAPQGTVKSVRVAVPVPDGDGALIENVALPVTPDAQVLWILKAPAATGAARLFTVTVRASAVRVMVCGAAATPPVGGAVSVIVTGAPTISAPARAPVVGTVTTELQGTDRSFRVAVPVPDGDGALTEKVALPVTADAQVLWTLKAPAGTGAARLFTVTVRASAVRVMVCGAAAMPPVGGPVSVIVTAAPTTIAPTSAPVVGTVTVEPQGTDRSVRVAMPVPDGDGALIEKVALPVTPVAHVF